MKIFHEARANHLKGKKYCYNKDDYVDSPRVPFLVSLLLPVLLKILIIGTCGHVADGNEDEGIRSYQIGVTRVILNKKLFALASGKQARKEINLGYYQTRKGSYVKQHDPQACHLGFEFEPETVQSFHYYESIDRR